DADEHMAPPESRFPERAIAERVTRHTHREIDQQQRRDRQTGPRHITQIAQKPGHNLSSSPCARRGFALALARRLRSLARFTAALATSVHAPDEDRGRGHINRRIRADDYAEDHGDGEA